MSTLALTSRVDLSQVGPLAADLRACQGEDLVIDASAVTHLGALGLQLLASAARSWRSAGYELSITPRSNAFDDALAQMGVGLAELQSEEAA